MPLIKSVFEDTSTSKSSVEQTFMTRKMFTELVESSVKKKKLSYIDACVHVCETEGIDPADVKRFVGAVVKEKVENEAMAMNALSRD